MFELSVTLVLIWPWLKIRINNNNNNLLLGSSITKSGLHRGPNTRYILYNDTIKIYKLELKPKYRIIGSINFELKILPC